MQKILLSLSLCAIVAYSAVNYPYPQRKNYGNATINAVNSTADTDLKAKFQAYMTNFYVEGNCSSTNDCARIKFYDPDKPGDDQYTVSEGIGYAMIMAVYFSDATKSYETEFGKLWKYYQKWSNDGVMHWKIQGFSRVDQTGSASDAEFDVALALAMARYQFGNTQYETDAKNLIAKIRTKEFDNNGIHKPGDSWDNDKNPSYISPAAFQIFKELEGNQNAFWDNVISKNYTLLTTNRNSTTGLPSNWANANGSVKECSACGYSSQNYGQDAVRAPWRWAWASAWHGHSQAANLLEKLAAWVNGKNATEIKGPISLTGTMGSNANSSYLGSLMCALTYSATYQTKLNSFFNTMIGTSEQSYYNQSMQILTGLLASGNMPNLKACAAGSCGSPMDGGGDGSGITTKLDRLASAGSESEDDRSLSWLWESWYAYTDVNADDGSGGKAASTITNTKFAAKDENNNCQPIESYRVILEDGTDWTVKIPNYTLNQGTYKYQPFVALGLDARKNGKPISDGGYDLSKCTDGFRYSYKGSAHRFKVLSSVIPEGEGSDHYKDITTASASNWTTVNIPPGELAQPTWITTAQTKNFDLAKVRGWAWELVGSDKPATAGLSANTGSLAIKDFLCRGDMPLPAKKASKCDGDGGEPIKPIEPPEPIISLTQSAASGAFAVRNGVNLRVSQKASMEVFGLNGKSVRKMAFSSGNHSISLNDLPKGLYIVMVKIDNRMEILRIPIK
jgi:endo-1,4-beta-D-glucanase Y